MLVNKQGRVRSSCSLVQVAGRILRITTILGVNDLHKFIHTVRFIHLSTVTVIHTFKELSRPWTLENGQPN